MSITLLCMDFSSTQSHLSEASTALPYHSTAMNIQDKHTYKAYCCPRSSFLPTKQEKGILLQ